MSQVRVATKMAGNLKAERVPLLFQVYIIVLYVHVHNTVLPLI